MKLTHTPAAGPARAAWTPLPDLVGTRSVPWQDKRLIDTTATDAAAGVIERYDRNGDGRLDARTESTVEDTWSYWANADGSQFSGYTFPDHLAVVRTTSTITDLLAAAAQVSGSSRLVAAADIATVLAGYDTNRDGRLTWDDAHGGTRMPQFFGDLTREVGERVVGAERNLALAPRPARTSRGQVAPR